MAGSRGLGTLTLDLIAKIGGFIGPMSQAERAAAKNMSNIERRANAFGRAIGTSLRGIAGQFLAFAGVSVTVGAAIEGIKKAIDLADETRDLSIQLGTSTETISAFRYAAQQTGTDMDALAKGMKILAKNAAAAINPTSQQAKVFESLGIKVTDASGKLKQLDQLIPEVANKFKGLEDGTTKAALAQALFGKSGLELTEFLNQGGDGLKTLTDKARELGIVIDQQTADAADKFKDDLHDLTSVAGGLAIKVAKELLPSLDKMVTWATGWINDGGNAAGVARDLADAFNSLADALGAVAKIGSGLGWIRDFLGNSEGQYRQAIHNSGLGGLGDYLKQNFPQLYNKQQLEEFNKPQRNGAPGNLFQIPGVTPTSKFSVANSSQFPYSQGSSPSLDEKKVAAALGGGGGGAKKTRAGKSDAEREAEQLQAAYKNLADSLKEQAALHGEVTEVAKVRYALENGELSKLSQAQKDNLLTLAAQKDAQEAHDKLVEQGKALTESLITPTEELNKKRKEAADLLAAGAIAQDAYNRAIASYKDPGQQMLEDLQFELALMKMTNAERATAIQLRGMDAGQVAKYGSAIADLNSKIEQTAKLTQFADGVRGEFVDLFSSIIDGSKSAKEALTDFFDNIAAMITQMIAKNFAEKLFGSFGSSGQGSTGGDWIGSIFSLFGGGRASGGAVSSNKFYEVGENDRPELLYARGKQYLIPGNEGRVVPMRGGSGGSVSVVQNISVQGRVDARAAQQMQQEAAVKQSRALARNH